MATSLSSSTSPSSLSADMRMTPARKEIYTVLSESMDHPTATDVFIRVKDRVPGISLATVYNTLESLTHAGMIKQVNLERSPSRYCANQHEHVHFHCEKCHCVIDAPATQELLPKQHWKLPRGVKLSRMDITLRGLCPSCSAQ